MRACVLHEPAPVATRPLRFEDVADPVPGPGDVLIRVHACGVCRTDLHVVEGDLERRRLPVIPGHQVVGAIESAPDGCTFAPGDRVGVAWLHCTCGACRFCASNRENLCVAAAFTGWTHDGGYAERIVAPADFVHPLPDALDDRAAAPLLCAGIIGFRCLERCALPDWSGAKLGLYGFGNAGHIAIQIARARGAEVFVCTRDERHRRLAAELGAAWTGAADAAPPTALDASIIFAPAGELIPPALAALDSGGTLVLGGIHMSPTPPLDYDLLYHERQVRSVTNNTRADGRAFLEEAARVGVTTRTTAYPLAEANDALIALKHDAIEGGAVLVT